MQVINIQTEGRMQSLLTGWIQILIIPFIKYVICTGSLTSVNCGCLIAQSCLTLCNPMDSSLPGSSVHGIFQAIVLEWIAISFSREIFPTQGLSPGLPHCRQTLQLLSRSSRV